MNYTGVDFTLPFDPTGYASLSGAQIAQLVGGLTPNTNAGIGLSIVTTDVGGNPTVPNVAAYPKLANYLWIRIQPAAQTVVTYVWNPNAAVSATLQQWVVASPNAAASITGAMIAANTITYANIASILWTQLPSGGAVGGCLTGNMPNPGFAPGSIYAASIVGSNVEKQVLTTDSDGNTAWVSPGNIAAGNYLLGIYSEQQAAAYNTNNILAIGIEPTTANTTLIAIFGAAGTISYTPKSTVSKIVVEVSINVWSSAAHACVIALFGGTAGTTLLNYDYSNLAGPGAGSARISLSAVITNGALIPYEFSVYASGTSPGDICYINKYAGQCSTFKITEYI